MYLLRTRNLRKKTRVLTDFLVLNTNMTFSREMKVPVDSRTPALQGYLWLRSAVAPKCSLMPPQSPGVCRVTPDCVLLRPCMSQGSAQ